MGEKLNRTVRYCSHSFVEWLSKRHFGIIVVLSLLHIGLAYIHIQHSSGADYRVSLT